LKETVDMNVAVASVSGGEIELEIRVGGGGFADVVKGSIGQRGAAKVGVENDAGGVDYWSQRVPKGCAEFTIDRFRDSRQRKGG